MSPQKYDDVDVQVLMALTRSADIVIQIIEKILGSTDTSFTRDFLISEFNGSRMSMALSSLNHMVENGLVSVKSDQTYSLRVSRDYLSAIKNQLLGYLYAKSEEESATFDLVMTTPKEPSLLKKELSKLGANKSLIKWTTEAFEDLVRKAQKEIIVMTPFLDRAGANLLLRLIKAKGDNVKVTVILRFLESRNSEIYDEIRADLEESNVKVFDYSIEREGTKLLETFHAKVILADNNYCYLGSSNLDKYSIDNSMELGALITGESVRLLKALMNIIISISKDKSI